VHLFDIDMSASGGIVFKESDTLTGGDRLTIVETGAKLSSITLGQNAKLAVR
jgi:hypothetical protein